MPDLLMDLEAFFIGNGTAVFRDTMPDSPDTTVALYEYGSQVPQPQIAGALRSVQVVARDKSATSAKNKARELYNLLVTDDGILNVTESRWCMVHLRNLPIKIKEDSKGRQYYGFNVGFTTYSD